ncbi:MAG: hypothetical protein OSJ54_06905 [Oscillospiraceae bacterium]|nr:hypothetical protein [Oscillospiraceae bacterium]
MNPVEKDNIKALAEAIKSAENPQNDNEIGGSTAADLINAILAEPDKKKRTQMMKDYAARRRDVAKFLADNADLINAEAEAALIGAAVGGTHTEKEVSFGGGKKSVKTKRVTALPNVTALQFLLKNRLPGKYSDKPVGDTEIEDVSEIEEDLYGDNS